MVIGVLRGMCNELYELYECFGITKKNIVASGGGVRKNDVLKRLIADRFGVELNSAGNRLKKIYDAHLAQRIEQSIENGGKFEYYLPKI